MPYYAITVLNSFGLPIGEPEIRTASHSDEIENSTWWKEKKKKVLQSGHGIRLRKLEEYEI